MVQVDLIAHELLQNILLDEPVMIRIELDSSLYILLYHILIDVANVHVEE